MSRNPGSLARISRPAFVGGFVLYAVSLAILPGCGTDPPELPTGDTPSPTDPSTATDFTASLHATILWSGGQTEIGGMLWSAQCEGGTTASAWVPLLPTSTDLPTPQLQPPTLAADWFVVLPPGECTVTVEATDQNEAVSADCASVTLTVVVTKGVTTELVVAIPCGIQNTGGIDVVGVINTAPVLSSVDMVPEIAKPCEPAMITANAQDPDGDPLSYLWVPLQTTPAVFLTTTGAHITFVTPGPFPLRLVVQDGNGGETGIDIYVPVSGPPMAQCP